ARPAKLLRNDGTIATQVVHSVYVADPRLARDNMRFGTGTKVYTLRSFLSANAIRARNSIDDIDYCSSNNSTVCAVQAISVPVLFAAMGAHYFIRDNERLYEMARSNDKDFIVIEGAVHGFAPCTAHARLVAEGATRAAPWNQRCPTGVALQSRGRSAAESGRRAVTIVTHQDIKEAFGPLDDVMVAEIVGMGVTPQELAEAKAWLTNDEALLNTGRPLAGGRVGRLVDLIATVKEEDEEAAGEG